MPLRLFRSRNVAGANLIQALLVVGMFGMFFLGALYMQRVLGYDALEVGLAFLPATLVMGAHVVPLLRAARACASARRRRCCPGIVADRRRAAALRADPGRRRPTCIDLMPAMIFFGLGAGAGFPVADDACAMSGADRERLRARLRPGQHQRAGRRRDRPRHPRDAGDRSAPSSLLADGAATAAALNSGYHLAYLIGAALALVVDAIVAVVVVRSEAPAAAAVESEAEAAAWIRRRRARLLGGRSSLREIAMRRHTGAERRQHGTAGSPFRGGSAWTGRRSSPSTAETARLKHRSDRRGTTG